MAQFAFYKTQRWARLRQYIIKRDAGMCVRCGERGTVAHHTIYVDASNCHDPNITYNPDLLETLCQTCHNQEHHGKATVCIEGLQLDENGMLVEVGSD